MGDELKEGWGFPGLSRKAHYFIGGRSLCLKWLFFGRIEDVADPLMRSPDDCAACHRRLVARHALVRPKEEEMDRG